MLQNMLGLYKQRKYINGIILIMKDHDCWYGRSDPSVYGWIVHGWFYKPLQSRTTGIYQHLPGAKYNPTIQMH